MYKISVLTAASQESSLNLIFLPLILDRSCPPWTLGRHKVRLTGPGWPGQPDPVLHFKRPRYHFCHVRPPFVRDPKPRRGPLSNAGVDVKMVGSEVVTLIVRPRVGGGGGGPGGYFQRCVTAARTGPCE